MKFLVSFRNFNECSNLKTTLNSEIRFRFKAFVSFNLSWQNLMKERTMSLWVQTLDNTKKREVEHRERLYWHFTYSLVRQMHFRRNVSISWEFETSRVSFLAFSRSNWSLTSLSWRWCFNLMALSLRKSDDDVAKRVRAREGGDGRGRTDKNGFIYD